MRKTFVSRLKVFSVACCMLFLSACATTNALDERDPWEGFNRGVYSFNETMDDILFNPIGKVYNAITPDIVDTGVTNFFSNIGQISVVANDLMQFKFDQAVNDTVRFMINSTLGLAGFFDILSSDLPSSDEDFGQTLAHWGLGSGPFLMVPFFGPATVRDVAGFALDQTLLNPISYLDNDKTRAGLLSLNYIDFKSDILSTRDLLEEAALDKYEFVKNAYFEKRADQIGDSESAGFPEE